MKRKVIYFSSFFTILFTQMIFEDMTDESGTDYTYPHFLHSMGAGVSVVDLNNDGLDDIITPTYIGEKIKIFINNGDSTFVDMAHSYGINDANESKQVLIADYDNDGFNDIYILNFNEASVLYRNFNNDYFLDVTLDAGLSLNPYSFRGGAWFDYDRDGLLDLFVVNYYFEDPWLLYHNQGDGTFLDVSDVAGVSGTFDRNALVVSTFDYDNDGWIDIYVGNDREQGNYLYRNMHDGTFQDVSQESGAGIHVSSMSISVFDYELDNDLDIYITNVEDGNKFLKNNGDGTFIEIADELGLSVNRITWGATFIDIDNDGLKDLYVASACDEFLTICSSQHPLSNNDLLYSQAADNSFTDISDISGLDQNYMSYGSALGDLNNDGYDDLYILHESTTNILFLNNYSEVFNSNNNWVKIKLEGTKSNYNGIGSRVYVYAFGNLYMEEIMSGIGYESQNSYSKIFGLGINTNIDSISVVWPSGIIDSFYDINVNQHISIVEAQGILGCMDDTACNFSPDATYSDESCIFPNEFHDCNGECILEIDCFDVCGGSAEPDECEVCGGPGLTYECSDGILACNEQDCEEVYGCMYETACNYNNNATIDDNSCLFPDTCEICSGQTDGSGIIITQEIDDCGVCDGDNSSCSGCMNPESSNYDSSATIDDGSCDLSVKINLWPDSYKLSNYPNPFNGSTRITLHIPKMHNVIIKVYNANGLMINELFNGSWIAGVHEVNWNPHNVPSGVYFISVSIEGLQTIFSKAVYLK